MGHASSKNAQAEEHRTATINKHNNYGDNTISTSKYTLLSFVPRSLFEQFRRVANVYFLGISVLMLIGEFLPKIFETPLQAYSTLGPLCLILVLTMIKEGAEDWKRHVSDREVNNRTCPVLQPDGTTRDVLWKDLYVGALIRVANKGEVPADVIVLATSEPKGAAYVETSQIDGETNLKLKEALGATSTACDSDGQLGALAGEIVYDTPNDRIHHFTGKLRTGGPTGSYAPVGAKNMVLRGCTVRNTRWLVGLVVYTGRETKVMKKSGGARSKMSRVEQTMNTCIKIVFAAQAALCTLTDVALAIWQSRWGGQYPYLHTGSTELWIPWWLGSWFTFLLLFNNFIPISLYITVEVVNYAQAFLVDVDGDMYCGECDTPAKARTSNLNQDLGQIEYVFSDKTGTLTRNVMEFKQAAISGRVYGRFTPEADDSEEEEAAEGAAAAAAAAVSAAGCSTPNLLEALGAGFACCWRPRSGRPSSSSPWLGGAVRRAVVSNSAPSKASSPTAETSSFSNTLFQQQRREGGGGHDDSGGIAGAEEGKPPSTHALSSSSSPSSGGGSGFSDPLLLDALLQHAVGRYAAATTSASAYPSPHYIPPPPAGTPPALEPSADPLLPHDVVAAEAFFTVMAVCHTVVPEYDGGNVPTYQAESPDEAALTKAARDAGFEFRAREADHVMVRRHGTGGTFTDLRFGTYGVHEFNSTRKRMSLVASDPAGRVWLMCKGADNVMFDRSLTEPTRASLEAQLTAFATKGLRTLVLAQREMSPPEFRAWKEEFAAASVSLSGREEALAGVAEKYERGLQVVGATAIEDRLQAGVPGTIRDLARAGIKTWVLTGDKVETAINIGFSCRLLDASQELLALTSEDPAALRAQLAALQARFQPLVPPAPQSLWARVTEARRRGSTTGLAVKATGPDGVVPSSGGGGGPMYAGPEDLPRVRDATALVMTGPCLTHILGHSDMEEALLTVARCCRAVIACRVSPQQKALIVQLVRARVSPRPMTLAIGDGANDVGMIQRAEVGVGISGKEGLQAVNAADFAIAQFRFLRRLLLVHGRWDYRRMTKVVLYSFYKNVVITLSLFYFTALTGFSGTSFYESLVYSAYNFVLGLPIIFIGITERDIPAADALAHPAVYTQGRLGLDLNARRMAAWLAQAVAHSCLVFWLPYGVYGVTDGDTSAGGGGAGGTGLAVAGLLTFSCLVWGMTLKVAVETLTWTYLNVVMVGVSLVGFYAFILVYAAFPSNPSFFGVAAQTLGRPSYWLTLALVLGAMVLVELTVMTVASQVAPAPVDIARELGAGYGSTRDKGGRLVWGDEEASKQAQAQAKEQPPTVPAPAAASSHGAPPPPPPAGTLHTRVIGVQVSTPAVPAPTVSRAGERRLSGAAMAAAIGLPAPVLGGPPGPSFAHVHAHSLSSPGSSSSSVALS